jgi:DNA-binding CsgD family transcriptional regulator/N-acetylneuraminic acid mutarotase
VIPELPPETLSEREIEILRLVATGASNKEIAAQLVISPNTVKVHLRNIFTKIGVVSRTEATLFAIKNGFVEASYQPKAEEPAPLPIEAPITPLELISAAAAEPPPPPGRRLPLAGIILLATVGVLVLAAVVWALIYPPMSTPVPTLAPTPAQSEAAIQPRWSSEIELPEGRRDMAAVVYENSFYLFGGETRQAVSAGALRYDLRLKTWQTLAEKPTAVSQVQGVVLGEKVYVPGGQNPNGKPVKNLEVYDLRQNAWQSLASLPTALSRYCLAAYEGKLYLFGGWDGKAFSSTVYRYDPEQDEWTERAALPGPRGDCGAVALEGKLLVIGGFDGTQALAQTLAYFPNRDSADEDPWEERPALPEGRYGFGAAALANSTYVFGGQADGQQPLVLTADGTVWSPIDYPLRPLGQGLSVLAAGNTLHLLGGAQGGTPTTAHQVYQALYTITIPFIDSSN